MTVRLMVFTIAGLTIINGYSFASLYSKTNFSGMKKVVAGESRMPAAIEQAQIPVPGFENHLMVDLNCQHRKNLKDIKVKGQWAQIKGRVCAGEKVKLVEITNLNNGFTASVFELGDQKYQTDLIQLTEGDNKIRVRVTPTKGDVQEQTVVITSAHM